MQATPLLTLDWLTAADLVVISLGSLVIMIGCLIWDYKDRQKEKQIQRQLDRSILDAKSRVYKN